MTNATGLGRTLSDEDSGYSNGDIPNQTPNDYKKYECDIPSSGELEVTCDVASQLPWTLKKNDMLSTTAWRSTVEQIQDEQKGYNHA